MFSIPTPAIDTEGKKQGKKGGGKCSLLSSPLQGRRGEGRKDSEKKKKGEERTALFHFFPFSRSKERGNEKGGGGDTRPVFLRNRAPGECTGKENLQGGGARRRLLLLRGERKKGKKPRGREIRAGTRNPY